MRGQVYGLDQNFVDLNGIGDWWRGRRRMHAACGASSGAEGDAAMGRALHRVALSGIELLEAEARKGRADKTKRRRVLILQHYPHRCTHTANRTPRLTRA